MRRAQLDLKEKRAYQALQGQEENLGSLEQRVSKVALDLTVSMETRVPMASLARREKVEKVACPAKQVDVGTKEDLDNTDCLVRLELLDLLVPLDPWARWGCLVHPVTLAPRVKRVTKELRETEANEVPTDAMELTASLENVDLAVAAAEREDLEIRVFQVYLEMAEKRVQQEEKGALETLDLMG